VPVQAEAGVAGTMDEKALKPWKDEAGSENVVSRDSLKGEH
jgi:hypothetical protein